MSVRQISALLITLLISAFSVVSFAQEGTAGLLVMENSQGTGYFDNWTASFFSIGGLTQQQIERGGASFSAYNYFGLNYKLAKAKRFSLRPVFYYNTAGYNKYNEYNAQTTSLGDFHFVYSDYELANLGDVGVSMSFKVYLPISDYSRQTRMIAKVRPETYFTMPVGRFSSVSYVMKPDFYIQSQTAFVDDTTPKYDDGNYKFDPRKTTQTVGLEHYIEFNASMSRFWSLKPSIGFIDDWYNASPSENLPAGHNTVAKLALAVDMRVAKGLTFTLGYENKPKVVNRRDDLEFFRPEDNNTYLMTNASL
jgi:hypothetical protein